MMGRQFCLSVSPLVDWRAVELRDRLRLESSTFPHFMAAIITLGYDNARVKAGAAETRNIMDRTANHIREGWANVGAGLRTSGAAMVGGLTAAAYGAKRLIDHFSELNDLAARLGVDVEALQRVGNAAGTVGTDAESVVEALTRLNRELGDVENTKAAAALKTFGVTAESLSTMQPDEAIQTLAEAFQAAQAEGKGFNEIFTLMGKGAAALLPLLRMDKEEMKELFEVPVAKKAVVEALDKMGDKLFLMGARLLPTVATAFVKFTSALEANGYAFAAWLGMMDQDEAFKKIEAINAEMDKLNAPSAPPAPLPPVDTSASQKALEVEKANLQQRRDLALAELGIMELRAKGHDRIADKLAREMEIQKRALELQKDLNLSRSEAVEMATRENKARERIDYAGKHGGRHKIVGAGETARVPWLGLTSYDRLQRGIAISATQPDARDFSNRMFPAFADQKEPLWKNLIHHRGQSPLNELRTNAAPTHRAPMSADAISKLIGLTAAMEKHLSRLTAE